MTRLFVTGVSGFIGSHLTQRLAAQGHAVLGIDRNQPRGFPEQGEFLLGEVLELEWNRVREWQPEVMVHLAESASVGQSFQDLHAELRKSLEVTAFLLEKWRATPALKLLYVSSAAVYGNQPWERYHEELPCVPISPYGVCKLAAEQLIRIIASREALQYVIVRPFSVYGAGLHKQVIYDLTRRFLRGEKKLEIVGTGQEQRDFVHIDDCSMVLASIAGAMEGSAQKTINIGTGRPVTLSRVAEIIAEATGFSDQYRFAGKDLPGNPASLVADNAQLTGLGFSCDISIEEGLPRVIQQIRESIG